MKAVDGGRTAKAVGNTICGSMDASCGAPHPVGDLTASAVALRVHFEVAVLHKVIIAVKSETALLGSLSLGIC